MIKRVVGNHLIEYGAGKLTLDGRVDFGDILVSEIDPEMTEDDIYEWIVTSRKLAPCDTPRAVSWRLMKDGYINRLQVVDVTEFADEYYTLTACVAGNCANVTLDPTILTDEFLKCHLVKHYLCLLCRLDRAPKFAIPLVACDIYGTIRCPEVAEYIVANNSWRTKITCLHESVIRAEWTTLVKDIPTRLMTEDQFIRHLDYSWNDGSIIPDHLHSSEVYKAIVRNGDIGAIPINNETIDIILGEHTWSFWKIVGKMTIPQIERCLEIYSDDIGGWHSPIRFEDPEVAEFMVRKYNVKPTWTTKVAEYFFEIENLRHLVPGYMIPSRAKRAC